MRYSDGPYSTWSDSIAVASNITSDDIAVISALPNGAMAVMWSNQNNERFGFCYHLDEADPASWSATEKAGSQSALERGGGMADDHLNVAVSSDGTLYAAVKTS